MSYNNKNLKTDSSKKPIPQVFDETINDFRPVTGSEKGMDVAVKEWPDGIDAIGVNQPTGGVGIRGWLSGIYSKLSGILSVEIDQTTDGQTNRVVAKISQATDENGVVTLGSSTLTTNSLNVTTAGSRVQLPNIPCREVTIIAKRVNTGYIYAGDNSVSSTDYGVELASKESFTFAVANANLIHIDSSVSGEGIS